MAVFGAPDEHGRHVAFSSNGRLLMTAHGVRLASTGTLIAGTSGYDQTSGDGQRVFNSQYDSHSNQWLTVADCLPCLSLDAAQAVARSRLARPALTAAEAQRFTPRLALTP